MPISCLIEATSADIGRIWPQENPHRHTLRDLCYIYERVERIWPRQNTLCCIYQRVELCYYNERLRRLWRDRIRLDIHSDLSYIYERVGSI
jgi:hypothetical protein